MKKKLIKIGTRASQLAMTQALWVKNEIIRNCSGQCDIELVKIMTKGDKILDVALAKVGGKGLFVKELEEALLRREVDLAVHSMKDVPAELPDGLDISIVTKREDPRDVLITKDKSSLANLKRDAVIGTSSLRRSAQLLHFNPEFKIRELRGNLNTRMDKLSQGDMDGIILASAGIIRMGWTEKITEYIPSSIMLSAVGQGALGIETRCNDEEILNYLSPLMDNNTYISVSAERGFLKRLEGGCQVPIACNGFIKENSLYLDGLVSSISGDRVIRRNIVGDLNNPEERGVMLAEELIKLGADIILQDYI